MAIDDLLHVEHISNATVDTGRFKHGIYLSRLVCLLYKTPTRHDIGGFLLDTTCKKYRQGNKSRAIQDLGTIEYGFLGNSATVKRMPDWPIFLHRAVNHHKQIL